MSIFYGFEKFQGFADKELNFPEKHATDKMSRSMNDLIQQTFKQQSFPSQITLSDMKCYGMLWFYIVLSRFNHIIYNFPTPG